MKKFYLLFASAVIILLNSTSVLAQDEFITTWKTDNPGASNATSITIPTTGGGYNYDVDWNDDGIFDQFGITGDVTHDFGVAGTYTIRIRGSFPRIYFNFTGDRQKILEVNQWGNIAWTTMYEAFSGCSNLQFNTYQPLDAPDLSGVTSLREMLRNCTSFNSPIGHWDVSNIRNMSNLFSTTPFNQDISGWDMSNVTSISRMFYAATSFNQDISGWDTSSLISMAGTFFGASSFNQDISNWDVSNVVNMDSTFRSASAFNQDISTWDVSSVVNMTNMFEGITLPTPTYDNILVAWNDLNLRTNVNFHGGNSRYCSFDAIAARANMIASDGWIVTDGGIATPQAICIGTPFTLTLDSSGNATLLPSDIDDGSYACDTGILTLSLSQSNFSCADLGSNSVSLIVDDGNGNTDSCSTTVIVVDGGGPIPDLENLPDVSAECEVTSLTPPTASDSCSTVTVTNNATLPITTPGTVITWTYEDGFGNTTTQDQNVVFTDSTGPVPDIAVLADVTEICEVTSLTPPTATDNCSSVTVTNNAVLPISTPGTTVITWTYEDIHGNTTTQDQNVVIIDGITPLNDASASNTTTISDCNDTTIQLSANLTGEWSAVSIPVGNDFSFSDVSDPNATFSGESGATYEITWTLDNPSLCADFTTSTFNVSFPSCGAVLDFDGTNDCVNFGDNNSVSGSFSIEIWVKPIAINGNIQSILSKRDADDLSTGYDLRLVNNTISFHSNNFSISANGITSDRWYHIAVVYSGTIYTLYVDGELRESSAGPAPTSNSEDMLFGAMNRANRTPVHHYMGWMDEVRIWNIALSTEQIREMMNQEIEDNTAVRGSVLGLDIDGLNWNNLDAYYQMNQGTEDIISGFLVGDVGPTGRLNNIISLQGESAPIPYLSSNNGNWDDQNTWINGDVQMIPNTNNINWNIVRTDHNISSGNRPTTLLGLLIDSNTYSITNDQLLQISKYLKIDGTLDLVDESQLLQDSESIVDYSGTGRLERDQQGTTNLFNYNFWSSPVGNNGISYALSNVLYDGSDVNNPIPVQWSSSLDANGTTIPITLSNSWLYIYENYPENNYADWNAISETTAIPTGLGFTMKGSGNTGIFQNYTFAGQPNNGTIVNTISGGFQALVGNPYPSALDAYAFINDNSSVLSDGTLYFWEHSPTNNSHMLAAYEGGYAYLNLTTGVQAVSPPEINDVGTATKIPRRYIPVGQGFFVTANATGGTISFTNSQRAFVNELGSNSIFLRTTSSSDSELINEENQNTNKFIRLDFKSPDNAVRHLAIGFMDSGNTTDGIDYGYDGLNQDTFPNDMSFDIEGQKFIIQGVGSFDYSSSYPLVIDLTNGGNIEIQLAELENFDEDIDVFIYDNLNGTYTRINDQNFQLTLDGGTYANRFYLVFQEDDTLTTLDNNLKNITVNFLQASDEIYIITNNSIQIDKVSLVNIIGQSIMVWNNTHFNASDNIKIPVRNISEGNYILKIETNNTAFNKKIIIR